MVCVEPNAANRCNVPTYHTEIKVTIEYTDSNGVKTKWYGGPFGEHIQVWKVTDPRKMNASQICFKMRQHAVKTLLAMQAGYESRGRLGKGQVSITVGKCELIAIT